LPDLIGGTGIRRAGVAPRDRLEFCLMLAPYLTGTAVLVIIPIVLSIVLAFTAYDGLSRPEWHGLRNFREILGDPRFAIAVRNSLLFVALSVPPSSSSP
jgi:multiple sugar transport system permease protein